VPGADPAWGTSVPPMMTVGLRLARQSAAVGRGGEEAVKVVDVYGNESAFVREI